MKIDLEQRVRAVLEGKVDEHEIRSVLPLVYQDLELAVGTALSAGHSNAELDEFASLIDAGDDDGASAWLQHHCPDYPQVVERELGALLERLAALPPCEA